MNSEDSRERKKRDVGGDKAELKKRSPEGSCFSGHFWCGRSHEEYGDD